MAMSEAVAVGELLAGKLGDSLEWRRLAHEDNAQFVSKFDGALSALRATPSGAAIEWDHLNTIVCVVERPRLRDETRKKSRAGTALEVCAGASGGEGECTDAEVNGGWPPPLLRETVWSRCLDKLQRLSSPLRDGFEVGWMREVGDEVAAECAGVDVDGACVADYLSACFEVMHRSKLCVLSEAMIQLSADAFGARKVARSECP